MTVDAAFTHFPSLTTNRLHLRQIQPKDAEPFFAFKSDLEVTRRYGQEPHQSLDDTRAYVQRMQASYDRRDSIFWCITFKGESTVIGSCCFWNFDSSFHCAEIGYELHPAYWGQGIMAEAISALLTYGFDDLGLHRIEANPFAGNMPSRNLLHKLGFTYEGNLRQRHLFRDHFEDQLYFGLLKEEWLKSKSDTGSGNISPVEDTVHDRKQIAVKFLQLVIAGQVDEAYRKYVDLRGKHHNPFSPAGFPALQKAMIENHVQFPNKRLTVKNVIGDGDLAAVHSHIVLRPGETGFVTVHLFRFHGDKIVELWDCGQPVPADSPNKDGRF